MAFLEKLNLFLPTMVIVLIIGLAATAYLKIIAKKWKSQLNSIKWLKEQSLKKGLLVSLPALYIAAPFMEELICRMPLIIAFDSISGRAWLGILVSALLFSGMHWFGEQGGVNIIEDSETDDYELEVKKFEEGHRKQVIIGRIGHVLGTLPLGLLAGYFSIKYQSLWVAIAIHALWNSLPFVMVVALALLGGLLMFVCFIRNKWHFYTVRRKLRKKFGAYHHPLI